MKFIKGDRAIAVELPDGKGRPFKVGSFKKKEFEEWADLLDIERNAWSILKKAMNAIMEGKADYSNAYERTKTLLRECDRAFAASVAVASGAFAFFEESTALKEMVGGEETAILAFSVWCSENLIGYCIG